MLQQAEVVFDVRQLRNVCMEDSELMKELVTALIDDVAQHIPAIQDAIECSDGSICARLAHYVKGACANVGAVSMAARLQQMELSAKSQDFAACSSSLAQLRQELQKFSSQAATL